MPAVGARVVNGVLWDACWWLWTTLGVMVCLVSACKSAAGSSAIHESAAAIPDRKADLLFSPETSIRGRLVTCDNVSDADYRFPAETWSCYNMRIDGYRLRSYFTLEVKTNAHCTDDVTGKNDLAALCRELLAAHHIQGELWAALIVKNPSCGESEDERMMFLKEDKAYEWVKYKAGKGFIHTLRCMLME